MNKDFVLYIIDNIINKDNAICSDSFIEKLHIHILLRDTVNENDKKTIELFIKYNKEEHFKTVKIIFLLQFSITLRNIFNKTEDNYILKILTTISSYYFREIMSEKYQKDELILLNHLTEKNFKRFNKKIESNMFKNIEKNTDHNKNIKYIYQDGFNYILTSYKSYINIVTGVCKIICNIFVKLFIPFLFNKKLTYKTFLNLGLLNIYHFITINLFTEKDKINEKHSDTYKFENNIHNFFENINVVIEKNKTSYEFPILLKNLKHNLFKNGAIKKYLYSKTNIIRVNQMNKYGLLELLTSLLINDSIFLVTIDAFKEICDDYADYVNEFKINLKYTHDFIDILNEKPYQVAKTIPWINNSPVEHRVENIFVLENITLEYESKGGNKNIVLENVNLNFEIGKSHFLYGNSGCGKTTLLSALMKRIKITNGVIKFLGIHNEYTYFSIRQYLTYITSENALFSKDLYYNITYGLDEKVIMERENDVMETIIKYMNLFSLDKFIPTIKTTNATKLSKGQTQRVAIIRLFIGIIFNDTRILFLDEFTSNIDNKMEKIIFTELINLQKNPKYNFTIFYVSHNLYNMKYSDYNYEIDADRHSIKQFKTTI